MVSSILISLVSAIICCDYQKQWPMSIALLLTVSSGFRGTFRFGQVGQYLGIFLLPIVPGSRQLVDHSCGIMSVLAMTISPNDMSGH